MGNILGSRAKWMDEGEKSTKYFLHLENRHYTNKTIPKMIKEESIEITDQKNIILEIFWKSTRLMKRFFYLNLNEHMSYVIIDKLTDRRKKNLEGEISLKAVTMILKNMSNNKKPWN